MADERDVAGILLAVLGELQGIRAALERRSVEPNEAKVELLRAVGEHAGDRVFTCAELCIHASLPSAAALKAAIVGVVGALNPRRLGRELRRIEGEPLSGMMIQRCGDERDGTIWQVVRVSGGKAHRIA